MVNRWRWSNFFASGNILVKICLVLHNKRELIHPNLGSTASPLDRTITLGPFIIVIIVQL